MPLRRKLVELQVAPSEGRLVDLGVAIEVDEARTREWWRREHEVQRLDWKQVRILVNAEATSENGNRPWHPRQRPARERIQHSGDQLATAGNAFILHGVGLDRGHAEMHHQVGAALDGLHWSQRDIVDDAAVYQHSPVVGKHGGQARRDLAERAHLLPELPAAHDIKTLAGAGDVGGGREIKKPYLFDVRPPALSLQCLVEFDVVEQRITGKRASLEPAARDEDILQREIEFCGR